MVSGWLGALHFPVLHDRVQSAHGGHGGVGGVRRPLHAVLAQDLINHSFKEYNILQLLTWAPFTNKNDLNPSMDK